MSFDPRMSTVRPSASANARNRAQEEDNFMQLPDGEIAGCIRDMGIMFSDADLQKPNPQQIQRVFEYFAELLMNVTRDSVAPAMRAAAEDVAGQHSEVFSSDTRDLMGLFVTLRRLLIECGIYDFTFSDLYKPTRERLSKIFSYLINFIRFRESQTAKIDEYFNKTEKTKQRIELLYAETQSKEEILADLERSQQAAEATIREKQARSKELMERIRELKRVQERIADKFAQAREEQTRLRALLEEKDEQTRNSRADNEKLRPYTTQSPAALEASLTTLNNSLNADKTQLETLDRRARALQTSADSFATVTSDVTACTVVLHELQRDLQAEDAAAAQSVRNRDALAERSNNIRDIERQERLLSKQLENVQKRTEKLRQAADERRTAEQTRMDELRRINEEIRKDRGEKGREMERRRGRIELTERKMADLKVNIENEVHCAQDEYLKMDSHIRLYITEMEQSLG